MATFSMNVEAQKTSNGKKVLVAYFSRSGNTKAIASHIKELTGGDLFEIQTAKPYPADYHTCTEVAKKEKNDNARPELKEKVKNIEEYDIIFIGFPNWWGTMPMPILTFLESYKLEGKIVIPFCTHGGGGEQSCFRDFVKNTSKYYKIKNHFKLPPPSGCFPSGRRRRRGPKAGGVYLATSKVLPTLRTISLWPTMRRK